MDKTPLCLVAGAALLAGCASMDEAAYSVPPPGSTWRMSQKNTGSYGKDGDLVMTRSDAEWNGRKVVKMTNAANGGSIMMVDEGKWLALVTKDGKAAVTYDPPIGYIFPLKVGQSWKTHHKVTNHLTGKTAEYDYSCTVEGREKLTVHAGTFDTYRIVCDNPLSHDVTWFIPQYGVHARMDMRRKPGNPSGEGTQLAELAELNLAK